MPYAQLIGSGHYLPENCVSNDVLSQTLASKGIETSDEWISSRTGIRQRHLVAPGVFTSDLATHAAQSALHNAGITADNIDLIIVATSTPDYIFPSTACLVQAKLGAHQAAAFDVQAVCSGFVYALSTASHFIQAGSAKHVLVIGAETFSRIIDWQDRSTCVLFGDGAGAVVLQAQSDGDAPRGIVATHLGADGQAQHILHAKGSIDHGHLLGDPFLRMQGQAVFKKAVSVLEASARQVCAQAGIAPSDIDWFVPHQANVRILQTLAKRLQVPEERVVVTIDQHANTSAASVPLALDIARRDARIQSHQWVLLQGVGGGFTWGSVLLRT